MHFVHAARRSYSCIKWKIHTKDETYTENMMKEKRETKTYCCMLFMKHFHFVAFLPAQQQAYVRVSVCVCVLVLMCERRRHVYVVRMSESVLCVYRKSAATWFVCLYSQQQSTYAHCQQQPVRYVRLSKPEKYFFCIFVWTLEFYIYFLCAIFFWTIHCCIVLFCLISRWNLYCEFYIVKSNIFDRRIFVLLLLKRWQNK